MFINGQPDVFSFAYRADASVAFPIPPATPGFEGRLHPNWLVAAQILWYPNPAWTSPRFNVYRADGPTGPFIKLTGIPVSGNTYSDDKTRQASKYARDYYYVEAIVDGRVVGVTKVFTHEKELSEWHYLRKKEINRREWLMLRRFMGVDTAVFKRIPSTKYGYRCTRCWDPVNKVILDDHCPVCYGTSYLGGYYPAIKTSFQYDTISEQDALGPEGHYEPAHTSAWTIAWPQVDKNDLILHIPERRLYRVDGVQSTALQTVTVRQICAISHLPFSCVEYKLLERDDLLSEDV